MRYQENIASLAVLSVGIEPTSGTIDQSQGVVDPLEVSSV